MAVELRKITTAPWFPLDVYKRELSYEEWQRALSSRMALRWTYTHLKKKKRLVDKHYSRPVRPAEVLRDKAARMFDSFIIAEGGLGEVYKHEKHRSPRWPVASLDVFEAFYCANHWKQNEHRKWRQFARYAAAQPAKALRKLPDVWRAKERLPAALRPARGNTGPLQAELMDWRLPLSVDITLDDETLKFAFEIWLAGIRDAMQQETPKPFSDDDISDWRLYAILPAFDLSLWSEINGLKYTGTFISNHVYGDDKSYNINAYDRYRQSTRPLVDEMFTWGSIERFGAQIRLHRLLEKKMREHDPEKFDATFGPKGPPL
jgi:hypothetical protein